MEVIERKKKRWKIGVFFFLAGILAASWSSRIPDVQQKLGLNNAAWGTVLVAFPVGLIAGLFFSSWLIAKFGAAKIIIITCIIASGLLSLLGFANERFSMMIVLFFVGFIRTVMNIGVNTQAVELQQQYKKPIISTFHGVWSLACFVAIGIGTLMMLFNIIPLIHFSIIGSLCFLITLVCAGQKNNSRHIAPQKKPLLVMPDQYLFLLGITVFFSMAAENTMFDWGINYFDKMVVANKKFVTAGFTSFIIAMSLGRLLGDKLIHRYGTIRIMVFNGVLVLVGFGIASLFPFLLSASFGFLLIGLGTSTIVPVVYSLAAKSLKMQPAYAIASVTAIGYCGFLVNPLVVGFISQTLNLRWAFALMGVFGLIIIFLALRIKANPNFIQS